MTSGLIFFMGPEVIAESEPTKTFGLIWFQGSIIGFILGFNILIIF
jgi:hypothetical protein